jgi:hypothetical protein
MITFWTAIFALNSPTDVVWCLSPDETSVYCMSSPASLNKAEAVTDAKQLVDLGSGFAIVLTTDSKLILLKYDGKKIVKAQVTSLRDRSIECLVKQGDSVRLFSKSVQIGQAVLSDQSIRISQLKKNEKTSDRVFEVCTSDGSLLVSRESLMETSISRIFSLASHSRRLMPLCESLPNSRILWARKSDGNVIAFANDGILEVRAGVAVYTERFNDRCLDASNISLRECLLFPQHVLIRGQKGRTSNSKDWSRISLKVATDETAKALVVYHNEFYVITSTDRLLKANK